MGVTWGLFVGGGGGLYVGGLYVGNERRYVGNWSRMRFLGTFWKITSYWPHQNNYILAASRWTCSIEICRKMQKVQPLFSKFNQFSWFLCTKNNPAYWKQKWNIPDYNGFQWIFSFKNIRLKWIKHPLRCLNLPW